VERFPARLLRSQAGNRSDDLYSQAATALARLTLATALAATGALFALTGCHGDANTPEAKIAEQAVGVSPKGEKTKTVEANRDLSVVQETKVIDNTTGETLSDTTKTTPVRITQ
jgi:hypothetical protein